MTTTDPHIAEQLTSFSWNSSLRIAMEQLLGRIPDAELAGPPPVRYFGGAGATYLDTLPVRFAPRPADATATPAG